ncbi:MAG TPA: hypothetical protein ACQGQI_03340 [Xylella sp.]
MFTESDVGNLRMQMIDIYDACDGKHGVTFLCHVIASEEVSAGLISVFTGMQQQMLKKKPASASSQFGRCAGDV